MVFSQVLANRLGDALTVYKKIMQIEFTEGHLEDIKDIVATVRNIFDVQDYRSILGRYKVRALKKVPFETPIPLLLNRQGINQAFEIRECDRRELYMDNAPSSVTKTKILIKMPDPIHQLHNLNGVLKKANMQLPPGGVVFLQVPYSTFESAIEEITKELLQSFSNISAVKVIAIDIGVEENGVKVSRKEDLVVSPRTRMELPEGIIAFLSQPMAFSKYALPRQL